MSAGNGAQFIDKTKLNWCGVCGCAHYAHVAHVDSTPPDFDCALEHSGRCGPGCPGFPTPPITMDPPPNVAPEPRQAAETALLPCSVCCAAVDVADFEGPTGGYVRRRINGLPACHDCQRKVCDIYTTPEMPQPAGFVWCWRCQASKAVHEHEEGP